jgi:hypothetical protein
VTMPTTPSEKPPPNVVIEAYAQMLTALFFGTLVVIFLGFLCLAPFFFYEFVKKDTNPHDVPLLATVMLTGSLGAFFSALSRLYSFDELPRVLIEGGLQLPRKQLLMYSLIPPLVGAIAALVLYFAFAGQLITGALFPSISCRDSKGDGFEACRQLSSLLGADGPDYSVDFAKVIVWSFIAGFAERLVPSMLDSISKAASNAAKENG